jgi:hypothetical protein
MTPLVRRYIKTSFVFLVSGLVVGAYIVIVQFLLDAYPPRLLVTAHAHLLLVGFMLMMVMAWPPGCSRARRARTPATGRSWPRPCIG